MKGNHPVANSERILFTRRDSLLNKMEQWAKYFAYVVIIIATLVLIIWQFNILKHPVPRLVAMNPVAAITFIFSGFSFLLLATKTPVPKKILWGRILACIIILIGLLRIISRFSELNIPIDTILFNERLSEESKGNMSNRMASNTAFNFMLLGIALLLLNVETRQKKMPGQIIALIISFIALLSIVGYLYKVNTFYGTLAYVPMAIHTAISFLFLSFAIFFVNPGKGPMGEFTSPFTGSFIARFLIPAAIIIPILLGFLRLQAAWTGIVSLESGAALLVLAIIIIFLALTWFIVVSLNKRDWLKQETDHALRESEEQIQTIFNAAPDAVIVMDQEGKIIQWNPKAESILGWSSDEVIGKLLSEIIIPERYREAHRKGIKHFLRTGEGPLFGKIVEISALTKSGNELDVALNIAASSRIKNRYLFIGFLRDLTGQKKAEEKFKALLDSAPDAMIIANDKGEIVLINQQTETLFGYVRDELIGKPVEILIPDDFRSRHKGHRDQYFSDPKVRAMGAGLELFAMRRDGTKFPVEISLAPLQTEEGLLVSASVRDISPRKGLENELKKTNAELEAFTYSVSHDLRAPLRGIIGFTAILEEDYSSKLDDEAKRITSVIKNNTLKMGHLIDALLAFSRMGKQEIMKTQINTQKMVHEIVDELVQQNNRHVTIGWNIHALPPVSADTNTIRQVWINLISNAIKYSGHKKHPYIEINSESRDGQIVFFVKDNGVGFDQQYSHKLFKVFQRLHGPEEFEGTGVGLALVEKIVSRHGGKVWAEGKADEGACFYFSLPI